MNTIQLDDDRTPLWHSAPAASSEPERSSGLGIGRYRLERILGEGTYGRVHLARQNVLERPVAVKILHRRHGSKKQEIRAFLNEALIIANLHHPGIVPVYDAGWTDDGFFYIVSRFVEGGDLGALLAGRRPAAHESAHIVMAIAEALAYAHSRGLVHRDIKPANILIDPPGKPLLTDFGVALRDQDFGRGAGLVGTPPYMSPEQARGEGNRVDGRSDIFGLGIVLYELLTGVRPFQGETQKELLDRIKKAEVRSPREIDPDVPEGLANVCLRALARRPSDRYSTGDEMASALRDWLRGQADDQTLTGLAAHGERSPGPPVIPSTRRAPKTSTISDEGISDLRSLRVVCRGLRPYEAGDAPFYLEMLPGARAARGLPECVEFWRSRIEGQSGEDCFRVGLLFGPSGCGKTSLVRAGLLPLLSERIWTVHLVATGDQMEAKLRNRLLKRCPQLDEGSNLASALIAARKGTALPPGKKLLIVVDQFERSLHATATSELSSLAAALRQCDGEHVQALVVVRDDCWSLASRFMRDLGSRIAEGENSAPVEPFHRHHARTILAAIGRAFGKLPDEQQALSEEQERFLDGAIATLAADPAILPIQLMLLALLARRETWDDAGLKRLDRAPDLVRALLDQTFCASAAPPEFGEHEKAARLVLRSLLPPDLPNSAGRGRTGSELLSASGYAAEPARFASLMAILIDELSLVSDLSGDDRRGHSDEPSSGERSYDITNDFLIEPLRNWLAQPLTTTRRHNSRRSSGLAIRDGLLRVNVNVATEEELRRLPGIGLAMARRLVAARPFCTTDDLLKVKGITAKNLRYLEPLIELE